MCGEAGRPARSSKVGATSTFEPMCAKGPTRTPGPAMSIGMRMSWSGVGGAGDVWLGKADACLGDRVGAAGQGGATVHVELA